MAGAKNLNEEDTRIRSCWGYSFEFTDEHLTAEAIDPLRHSYDALGDAAYCKLKQLSQPRPLSEHGSSQQENPGHDRDGSTPSKRRHVDLYDLLLEHSQEDDVLHQLKAEIHTAPDWLDWAQISGEWPSRVTQAMEGSVELTLPANHIESRPRGIL